MTTEENHSFTDISENYCGYEIYIDENPDRWTGGYSWSTCRNDEVVASGLEFTADQALQEAKGAAQTHHCPHCKACLNEDFSVRREYRNQDESSDTPETWGDGHYDHEGTYLPDEPANLGGEDWYCFDDSDFCRQCDRNLVTGKSIVEERKI